VSDQRQARDLIHQPQRALAQRCTSLRKPAQRCACDDRRMSRSVRRTVFAAPFVISVAAAGCGNKAAEPKPKPPGNTQPTWHVQRLPDGDGCSAHQNVECPPPEVATCNPPAPMFMKCPADAPASFKLVQQPDKTCVIEGQTTAVPCPTYDWPIKVAQRWEVTRAPDGTCIVADDPCLRFKLKPGEPIPPCNPPPPIKAECPPEGVVAIVRLDNGTCHGATAADCMADPRATCTAAPTRPLTCPQ